MREGTLFSSYHKCIKYIYYESVETRANVNNTLTVRLMRRKIILIEGNGKCRHLNKLTCRGTLRLVFICLRPRNPFLPPLQAVYVYLLYSILIYTGKGGGRVETERRLEGQQFTKLGRKYQHDWLYFQSINSEKHLPQRPFTGQFFWWRHFVSGSI